MAEDNKNKPLRQLLKQSVHKQEKGNWEKFLEDIKVAKQNFENEQKGTHDKVTDEAKQYRQQAHVDYEHCKALLLEMSHERKIIENHMQSLQKERLELKEAMAQSQREREEYIKWAEESAKLCPLCHTKDMKEYVTVHNHFS